MPTWEVCPHCGLKHTRRPDGICPRCKQALGEGGAVAPEAGGPLPDVYDGRPLSESRPGHEPAFATDSTSEVSTGARIAGAALLVNALCLVAERVLVPGEVKGLTGAPVSMLFDLLIGGALVSGSAKFIALGKIRAGLGGVILPAIHLYSGDTMLAALQVVFSAGILLLLLGDAGRLRIGFGVAAVGACLGLELLGLQAMRSGGSNPLAGFLLSRQVEKQAATVVEGEKFRYRLTSPNDRWFLRKADLAKKDNPLADRWLVRPDRDAHVLVIAEEVPGAGPLDMERFATIVLDNARKSVTKLEILGQAPLSHRLPARLLHTRGGIQGMQIESYYGLFIRDRVIFQVMAFSAQQGFAGVEPELRQFINSFESN